jgi:hypothetical protein
MHRRAPFSKVGDGVTRMWGTRAQMVAIRTI